MHQEIAPILTSAREEHIAIDPRSLIPSSLCRLPPLLPVTDIHEPFCFADDPLNKPPLPTFIIPQEKLIADNDTKISLASVIAAANSSFEVPDTDPEFDRANFRVRELEEPLVRADFTRDLVLRKSYIPKPILLDECKDEGLTWPPSAIEDVAKYQRTLQAEKLSGGEGVVKLLQAWVAEPKVDEDGLDPAVRATAWFHLAWLTMADNWIDDKAPAV